MEEERIPVANGVCRNHPFSQLATCPPCVPAPCIMVIGWRAGRGRSSSSTGPTMTGVPLDCRLPTANGCCRRATAWLLLLPPWPQLRCTRLSCGCSSARPPRPPRWWLPCASVTLSAHQLTTLPKSTSSTSATQTPCGNDSVNIIVKEDSDQLFLVGDRQI